MTTSKPTLVIRYGRLSPAAPAAPCYVCGKTRPVSNLVAIQADAADAVVVPLCEPCVAADEEAGAVAKKFWNTPDLVVRKATSSVNPFGVLH